MPKFSVASIGQLQTCDERLQKIALAAISVGPDFSIVEGHRGQIAQHQAFLTGKSKLDWPHGNHNAVPSRAFDFSPYPADWSEKELPHIRFAVIAGVLAAIAYGMGIKVRWGADWNRNWDPRDERFLDWGHIELDEP